jgi:hypothetical protein
LKEYHKIYSPFVRATEGPRRNKFIIGQWSKPEFEFLKDNLWIFTEKVDGTNIRIHWDGHAVTFGGRTDNAQIPSKLVDYLRNTFQEELFEQAFGETVATLYGEGYGVGIQKGGGNYGANQEFILFDVRVGEWWLQRDSITEIGQKLGVNVVPIYCTATLTQMITRISAQPLMSMFSGEDKGFQAEGVVGIPMVPMTSRSGERIIVKVKNADFHN